MTLDQLNCFIEVAQCLNFTKAAERLHMVQSSVSYAISTLEEELNVKLFHRSNRLVSLTPEGRTLLNQAYKITDMAKQIPAMVRNPDGILVGELRIGYVFVPIMKPCLPIIKQFNELHPQVHISFNSYTSVEIPQLIESGAIDFGFARYQSLTNRNVLEWIPAYKESLSVVVRNNHPLAQRGRIGLSELEPYKLILMDRKYNPGMFDLAVELCMKGSFSPTYGDSANDILTLQALVEYEDNYTFLPECWKEHVSPRLTFLDINCDSTHDVGIAWAKNNTTEIADSFISFLQKNLETPIYIDEKYR